MQYIKKCY